MLVKHRDKVSRQVPAYSVVVLLLALADGRTLDARLRDTTHLSLERALVLVFGLGLLLEREPFIASLLLAGVARPSTLFALGAVSQSELLAFLPLPFA